MILLIITKLKICVWFLLGRAHFKKLLLSFYKGAFWGVDADYQFSNIIDYVFGLNITF